MGLGGGSVRVNVFPDASTRLPKLDLELFHFFGRVNMYLNLVPRANLACPHPAAARVAPALRVHWLSSCAAAIKLGAMSRAN